MKPSMNSLFPSRTPPLPTKTKSSAMRRSSSSRFCSICALSNLSPTARSVSRETSPDAEGSPEQAESIADPKIGRAIGRERVCQYVEISEVAVSLQKKKYKKQRKK